jgi:hypothetical protein
MAISPTQWSIWPPDQAKLAAGPVYVYFTYTVVHLAIRSSKISCGARIRLFHLHRGPFGHPMKQNKLRGPYTAISPTQWSIWPPDQAKLAAGPVYGYFTCTVVHLATR